jgi:hypothetical protein
MRDGSRDAQAALARQGRYQTVRDNLRVKEVHIGEGDAAKRFIICHNPAEAEREKTGHEDTIHRLEAELDRIETQRAKANSAKAAEAHTRAECALRDHPSLGRYLRQTPSGRLRIDRTKIAAEERLDGKFLLSTSDPDLSAEDVALGYKNLLEAQRGFRDLKTTLELRPVFHRLEHRIRAHVLLSWLACSSSAPPSARPTRPGGASRQNSAACTSSPSPARPARSRRPPSTDSLRQQRRHELSVHRSRAVVEWTRGGLDMFAGNLDRPRARFTAALVLGREVDTPSLSGKPWGASGFGELYAGDIERARSLGGVSHTRHRIRRARRLDGRP